MEHLASQRLYKQTNRDWSVEIDNTSGVDIPVLHVRTQHALMQAIGYTKYVSEPWERVFLRGQKSLYRTLKPSAYRTASETVKSQDKIHAKIAESIAEFQSRCTVSAQIDADALEPLLQHYGIATTWIDVVDNTWVALWFALHSAKVTGAKNEFIHFDRIIEDTSNPFGYLILIRTDSSKRRALKKGFRRGQRTETVDLRVATPSIFLRPHAQHGLLFRECGVEQRERGCLSRSFDYSKHICGIIRFNLKDANDWMGGGSLHSVRSVFPPPYFDPGYQILLNAEFEDRGIGCIQHVGA